MSFFDAQSSFLNHVFTTNQQASCYDTNAYVSKAGGYSAAKWHTKHYNKSGQYANAYVSRVVKDTYYKPKSNNPNAICTDKYYRGKGVTNAEAARRHAATTKDWHDRVDWKAKHDSVFGHYDD
eukprot:140453_1